MRVETYPVAGAAYLRSDKRGASLTHAMDVGCWRPLCKRVNPDSVLDDELWGDLSSAPTCPACLKKDPRFQDHAQAGHRPEKGGHVDPEANYAEQQKLYGSNDSDDRERLKELVDAMREWVGGGGFKPKGYMGPAWKPPRKKKANGGPTAASIARQSARLEKAKEATAEAERFEAKVKEMERGVLVNEEEIKKKRNLIKAHITDNKSLRSHIKKAVAKGRQWRAKAARLAKP